MTPILYVSNDFKISDRLIMERILQQRKLLEDANHLHKPINQFRLIQRFRIVWPKVQEIFDDEDIVSIREPRVPVRTRTRIK